MSAPLPIRTDRDAAELRRFARRERAGRASARLLTLANAFEGLPREEVAAFSELPRPAVGRGAPPAGGSRREGAVAGVTGAGPGSGASARGPAGTAPVPAAAVGRPGRGRRARWAWAAGAARHDRAAARRAEAPGRAGSREPGGARSASPLDARDRKTAADAAVIVGRPERDTSVALVLPEVSIQATSLFLAELARAVPVGTHAVLVLDRAGRPVIENPVVPADLTMAHLPSHSPELDPVERVWLYPRERWLSHRVLAGGYEAVVDAACAARNALTAKPGRLRSLTSYPWLPRSVQTS